MAKQQPKASAAAKPASKPAQANATTEAEAPLGTDEAIEKILESTPPMQQEGEEEIQAPESGETETEPAEGAAEQTSEDAQPAETEEGGEVEGEEATGEAQEEDPDLEPLKEYADDKGDVDLKRLSKDIASLKTAQNQGKLTSEQEQDLRDMQHLKRVIQADPGVLRTLQEADARLRGVQPGTRPAAAKGTLSWEEAKATAKRLREEGKPEEAYEVLRANDPELVAMRRKLDDLSTGSARDQQERFRQEKIREYNAVEAKYDISDKVFHEMRRLCEEEGMGNRSVETVLKLASVNLNVAVKPKQPTAAPNKKQPLRTVNILGRGVAKGGGQIPRQPAQKPKNPFPEIAAVAAEMDSGPRKLFRK